MQPPSTIEQVGDNLIYCRTRSLKREELENALLALYGVTSETHVAFVFPSGVSAISAVLHAFARPDSQLVLGSELYCDTPKVAKWICERKLAQQVSKLEPGVEKHRISLVLTETCSNPSGHVPNYDLIAKLKTVGNPVVCLDNTWLTSALFNPFAGGGCDIVVESMSKYLSGGQCIGGMCVAKIEYADAIFKQIRLNGLHVTRETCEIVLRSLPSLEDRVKRASMRATAMKTALGLSSNDAGFQPPVFVVIVPLSKDNMPKWAARAEIKQLCEQHGIRFETSFGAAHSKIDCYSKVSKTHIRIRVAAGYSDDTIEDDSKIVALIGAMIGKIKK